MIDDIETPSTPKLSKSKKGRPLEVSPTLTEATSFSPQESPRTITVDHQVSSRGRGSISRGLILGMSKPIFALIAATVLATSGSAAWFFSEWLTIPGLKDQINALSTEVSRLEEQVYRLESQVDRLSTEVDELAHENDRYSMLNSQLNQTASEYQILNSHLNASTLYLSQLNTELNQSNNVFSELNTHLSQQNNVYASLNHDLNATQKELSALNEDLVAVVNFLNDTSSNLQQSLEAVVDFLAEQIAVNRFLVLETLKNTYQQRTQNWDCGYRDYFLAEEFIQDDNAPINGTKLTEILSYVDSQLLSSLCLDRQNFETYLANNEHGETTMTSNELIQGTSRYVSIAMDYYFVANYNGGADDGSLGIQPEEWAEAYYQCSNLERPFRWSQ